MVPPSVLIDGERSTPVKLMDEAYVVLEKMIVTGQLEPGRWVSETELIELSGFSRAPIRYALQRLSDQQLIKIYPRRGAQICPIDFTLQFRALELRRVVERLLVRSAAIRANHEQRVEFERLSEAFRAAAEVEDQATMTGLDFKTFALTVEAADNPFAAKAMTSVKGLSRRFWILNQATYGDTRRMAICHADIAQAISTKSEEEAEKAVDTLVDYLDHFTLKVIGYSGLK